MGVGLAIAMLTSLLTVATPASAGTLEFTTESLPSGITFVTNTATATGGLTDYAVAGDGTTIYAVNGGTAVLYKSTNSGATWSSKTLTTLGGAAPDVVAVAPDSPDIVAIGDAIPGIASFTAIVAGAGYTGTPTAAFAPAGTVAAAATVVLAPTSVAAYTVVAGGAGYTSVPTVTVSAPTGAGPVQATATATVVAGVVTGVAVAVAGGGYTGTPTVTISGGGGTGATATATLTATTVASLTVTAAGSFPLFAAPVVTITAGVGFAGAGAGATAVLATPAVWISTNGAATGDADSWSSAGTIGALAIFRDLAISPAVSGVREVVAAGSLAAAPGVFALNLGGTLATWTDVTATFADDGGAKTGVLGATATTSVFAVKFSPNYISDRVLVAISNDSAAGTTFLNLARFNTATSGAWNAPAFPDYSGAAGASNGLITTVTGIAPATLLTATISLSPTYTGLDSASRIAFVSIDAGGVATAGSGVYRTTDASTKLISDANMRFQSAAYNGTTLVAGRVIDNAIYRSSNALASTPDFAVTTQTQRPSGSPGATVVTNTMVAWAGANVVASTLGNESAFSSSADNGANFNDISMINTTIVNILNIAVAADGSKWYMVSNGTGGADTSVWSKTGTTWVRLMSIVGAAAPYSLRIPPTAAASNVVYLVNSGTTTFYYSNDGGDKNWATRITNEAVTDLSVETADIIYYVNAGGGVRKSVNAGFLWSDPAIPSLLSGTAFSIKSLGTNLVMVTSTAGVVSYSTAATLSFTRLGTLTGGGNIQATATTLATNDFVYAAGDGGFAGVAADNVIYRYKIGSVAPDNVWEKISGTPISVNIKYTGIILKSGVLYVNALDSGADGVQGTADELGSYLLRSINPTVARTSVLFDSPLAGLAGVTAATSPDFTTTKAGSLRTSNLQLSTATAGNTLWAIDSDFAISEESGDSTTTVNDEVYSLTDGISTAGPTLSSPAADAVIAVNPVSGLTFNVAFSFARPSLATNYEIQIAYDTAFNQPVAIAGGGLTFGVGVTAGFDPAVSPVSVSFAGANFNSGTTYYWRVRATAPFDSPWSATRSFSVGSLDTPFALAGPAVGATDVSIKPILSWSAYKGAKWYEVTVSEDPTFAIPEWSHNVVGTVYGVVDALKYSTTYYWRVRGVTADPFVKGTAVITPSGPYMTGAFTTMAEPTKSEPTVITIEKPAPPAPPAQIIQVPVEKIVQQSIPNWMLMTIIVIGAILVVALIVLIVRTRRVA